MRFQVPQFIEVEDKIFGPLTIKQFIYLAGGGGLSFIIYTYVSKLSFILAIIFIIPVAALSLALAFYKVNNRSFINVLESAFKYLMANKLYIWKKQDRKPEHKDVPVETSELFVPRLSDSKLKDLTWSLDINDIAGPGVKETMNKQGY
ncbi:MAG: PrgI family protein [Candidatus Taylorbacteria bacterium]|nr:PrgI family protein [Candidatus Taylorbacteria bacterium]